MSPQQSAMVALNADVVGYSRLIADDVDHLRAGGSTGAARRVDFVARRRTGRHPMIMLAGAGVADRRPGQPPERGAPNRPRSSDDRQSMPPAVIGAAADAVGPPTREPMVDVNP